MQLVRKIFKFIKICIFFIFFSFPCFQNPYPMDFHKSPVTYCAYFADCPNDLIPAFYSVGAAGTKQCGCSEKVFLFRSFNNISIYSENCCDG